MSFENSVSAAASKHIDFQRALVRNLYAVQGAVGGFEFTAYACHDWRTRTVMSGSRAGDGGRLAATCGAASHVTSWQRTRPLTSRGKEEGGQWFREKSVKAEEC